MFYRELKNSNPLKYSNSYLKDNLKKKYYKNMT